MFGFLKGRRRRKLLDQPLPDPWRLFIERNVAVSALLPEAQQQRLFDAVQIIVAERPFVGCKGLEITDEIKVTIAAQAALLLLGEEGYYFDRVPSILVYPMTYVRRHSLGEIHPIEEDTELLGESWQRGSIVLSWPAVLSGGRNPRDGQNLVLHEFAHHLDSLDGEMGGTPPLPTAAAQRRWREVFDREYARLCDAVADDQPTLLDPYGTTSQAELFAVATECFFERPTELRDQHPELFECLLGLYKVDPTEWFKARAVSTEPTREGEAPAEPAAPPQGTRDPASDDTDDPATPADLPPLETADQYFTRGCEFFDLGRYDLAEADFNQAVRLSPDDQEALLYRARARFYLDQLEAALADADRACRLAPDDKEAAWVRALCRSALGQFEDALADFEQATDELTVNIDALFYRGLARAECGYVKQAISDFSRVIEIDPQDAEAWYERSCCYDALGNSAAAQRDLAQARALGLEELLEDEDKEKQEQGDKETGRQGDKEQGKSGDN